VLVEGAFHIGLNGPDPVPNQTLEGDTTMTSITLGQDDTRFTPAGGRRLEVRRNTSASRKVTATLWTIQGALALLFLFAGSMKFIMPIEVMTKQIPFPAWFLYFIGVAEVLGAVGILSFFVAYGRWRLVPIS
jgi:hypothetical protein